MTSNTFYFTQEFWTAAAVVVALIIPWIIDWLSNRPKKSHLIVKGTSVINQDNAVDEYEQNMGRLLNVGRISIKNNGKFIAKSVEAFIEMIFFDGGYRADFIPVPLVWTHGQLGKQGPVSRDIYPNQTVSLDIFNYIYNSDYVGDNEVLFAIGAGLNTDNLSKMNLGESKILIKFYQESGQVNEVWIRFNRDGKSVPKMNIIKN